ncbi:MAG TPA: hypothetical protein PLD73_13220 [Candidatus Hydrogenedentes bacterium]|jgi:hypothetical protein|nr:hypothetical protein [Candidatus Hydrogenedentota bacterium]
MTHLIFLSMTLALSAQADADKDSLHERAMARQSDLILGIYLTTDAVERIFTLERDAAAMLRDYGFTLVTIEVYRSGQIVPIEHLARVRDYFRDHGFEVAGGIATTPGGDTGVRQKGPLAWYNWQNPKTQHDLEEIMRSVAPLFDTFVIDDFLCTGDVSEESKEAKGEAPWSQYRCELMAAVARDVFITPAREANPDITMIVKFPQWYDLFHEYGYALASHAHSFDRVWVGTETRGARTQRYGFVQPFEAFVNYRWIASVAPKTIQAAWFDHGDCDALDFVDQAYQSVLAGARILSVFNFLDVLNGHPGDELLAQEFDRLADLAAAVKTGPVQGVAAYKPVGSDAGGNLYVMDFIGMLGVPLVPMVAFPHEAKVLFLPEQAASDPGVIGKLRARLSRGGRVIVTAGFLARRPEAAELAGLEPVHLDPVRAEAVLLNGEPVPVQHGLDLAALLKPGDADVLLEALVDSTPVPFLIRRRFQNSGLYVLNCHTFSQADFDAVGEVLLAPRELGLLELPQGATDLLRAVFLEPLGLALDAPTRVCLQPFGEQEFFVQNYNETPVSAVLRAPASVAGGTWHNQLTGAEIPVSDGNLIIDLGARSRCWLKPQ